MSHRLSRRAFLRQASRSAAAAALVGCTPVPLAAVPPLQQRNASPLPDPERVTLPPLTIAPSVPHPHDLPLESKIAQMLLLGFRGSVADENSAIVRAIRDHHVGSVVLFGRNVITPEQLHTLTQVLHGAARNSTGIPLFIAVDQEGGRVVRLSQRYGIVSNYTAQHMGAQEEGLALTEAQARSTADALRRFEINLNLAPVVDVNVNARNPVIGALRRSFSGDPETVVRHASAFIHAHHNEKVLTTLKHFPGHGSSTRDSHHGFVDVTETWTEMELQPYRDLITFGQCDAIMTAHVFNANLDPDLPATLSRPTITGLLREQMGYNGLIITDDMQMGAIRSYYSFEEGIVRAVEAGVDIISIANSSAYESDAAARVIGIIKGMVDEGRIPVERIEQSFQRILAAKARLA